MTSQRTSWASCLLIEKEKESENTVVSVSLLRNWRNSYTPRVILISVIERVLLLFLFNLEPNRK